jgi:hypothetical protein
MRCRRVGQIGWLSAALRGECGGSAYELPSLYAPTYPPSPPFAAVLEGPGAAVLVDENEPSLIVINVSIVA